VLVLSACSLDVKTPANISCTKNQDCAGIGGLCLKDAIRGIRVCCQGPGCAALAGDAGADAARARDGGRDSARSTDGSGANAPSSDAADAPADSTAVDASASMDTFASADTPARPPEQFAWTAPGAIPTGATMPIEPHLAGDAVGNVAVVWQHDGGNFNTQLWWNRRRGGADWEIPEPVQDDPTYQGRYEKWSLPLAINGSDAYVAWLESDPRGTRPGHIMLRHFSDETGWDKPTVFPDFGSRRSPPRQTGPWGSSAAQAAATTTRTTA
jgi:hypothetical protein